MDIINFCNPAYVRSLVVPISEIGKSDFENVLETLRRVKDVRAVDLINNPGKFNPQAYPQGHIYYNFVTKDDDTESLFLHNFEPFRKTAVVIGITKWNENMNETTIQEAKAELKRKYPSPITQFVLIFDCPNDYKIDIREVYTVDKKTQNLETKICDLTSRFLSNFSTYVSAYEHTTLRSPGNLSGTTKKTKNRVSVSFDLNSEKVKQMSSRGRKLKLMANFYLMAGNLKSALSDFCEAIFSLKYANDYLWLASAFDGLAVCIFLLASIAAPFQLPQFLTQILDSAKNSVNVLSTPIVSPRSSLQINNVLSTLNSLRDETYTQKLDVVPLDVVEKKIFECGILASKYYHQAKEYDIDYVPHIVVTESLLRYATLMVLININGSLNLELINDILYSPAKFNNNTVTKDFDTDHFNKLCFHILDVDFNQLSQTQQMKLFYSLSFLFSKTKMNMKKCLMISSFIDIVINNNSITSVNNTDRQNLTYLLENYCESYGIVTDEVIGVLYPNKTQKKILLQILSFCRIVNFHQGYLKFGSLSLRHFNFLFTPNEQIETFETMTAFLKSRSESIEYWDPNLLVDFHFDTETRKLVEGEESMIKITVRNPFMFHIDIKHFKLSLESNFKLKLYTKDKKEIDNSTISPTISVRPYSQLEIPFIIVPENNGTLIVDGIYASVCGCKLQKFVFKDHEIMSFVPKINKKYEKFYDSKNLSWSIDVVNSQPFLKILDVKLEDKWLMLLDGERKQFKVTMKNTSKTEINYLVSMFKDSTTELLNAELNNKLLQPNEIYEIEYQLLKRKPFKILNKGDLVKIDGFELFDLDVEIIGKIGVNEASLVLEYSHQQDSSTEFHRNISIPVNLTVYPSVELAGCDIIPLTSNTKINELMKDPCWAYLSKMKENNHQLSNFCLLALDFINMWSDEMEITLNYMPGASDAKQTGDVMIKEEPLQIKTTLQSRKNLRMFLPLVRMDFDEEYLGRTIPSLRNKQFIVDKKTPMAEQLFIKHAFWYKEEILKRVKASWKILPNSSNSIHKGKYGDIDLRGFKFSSKMVEVLEVEKIGLSLKLLDTNDSEVELNNVSLNGFYTIRIQLTNRNKAPIFGMLRHIPVCKDPPYTYEKKVLINGVLQFSVETPLIEGESREYDLGIVFMEKGECEWGVLFDELDNWTSGSSEIKAQHLQREQLKFKVN